jgi:hypothetical protein
MTHKNNTSKRVTEERGQLSQKKFIFCFLIFQIYTYDNFSDLRCEVDDGTITFGNIQNTRKLISYSLEIYCMFSPYEFVRSVHLQGRCILNAFNVH